MKAVVVATLATGCMTDGNNDTGTSFPVDGKADNGTPADGGTTRSWHITTVANGSYPSYVVSPQGELAIATLDGVTPALQLSGALLPLPPNLDAPDSLFIRGIAFDSAGALHVLAHSNKPHPIRHFRWSSGSWDLVDSLPAFDRIEVRNGPHGEMYALAANGSSTRELSLISMYAATPSKSETLWSLSADFDEWGFTVGPDGFPALAWGSSSAYAQIRYARRGAEGWRQRTINTDYIEAWDILPTGGAAATVLYNAGGTTRYVEQDASGNWGPEVTTTLDDIGAVTVDGEGTVHTCAGDRHGQLRNGTITVGSLGGGSQDCWLTTDASGTVHIAYHLGTVINAGTYE